MDDESIDSYLPREVITHNYLQLSRKTSVHSGLNAGNVLDAISSANDDHPDELSALRSPRSHHSTHIRSAIGTHDDYIPSLGASSTTFTTLEVETTILSRYSFPLVITFLLQYSLNVASVFSVGRIGKTELAAVSLATMTANITGYCLFQGTSTSLDTLCAQAFGRRDYRMVGVHFIRCTIFMLLLYIPICVVWIWYSDALLSLFIHDTELVALASKYLSIIAVGLPPFIVFENCKHFLQAQNNFHASTMIISIGAPLNIFLNWFLVWNEPYGFGFIGAPISIVVTNYFMCLLIINYIYFVSGYQCFFGFDDPRIFRSWAKMLRLSYNGCIGVLSEWLAFEIITLTAAEFGTVTLASQSIITTVCVLLYQIPFAVSIAASTRIANLIGEGSKSSLVKSLNASMIVAVVIGVFNGLILLVFKSFIVRLFTTDEEVISLCLRILPISALYQIADCLSCITSGVLRGQGRQKVSAALSLVSYYLVALPIGFVLSFGLHYELVGLWIGLVIALVLLAALQALTVLKSDWDEIIRDALSQ